MSTKEIESNLVWELKCRDCKANTSAEGIESVSCAEDWMAEHREKTGHDHFSMDVLGFSIFIEALNEKPAVE